MGLTACLAAAGLYVVADGPDDCRKLGWDPGFFTRCQGDAADDVEGTGAGAAAPSEAHGRFMGLASEPQSCPATNPFEEVGRFLLSPPRQSGEPAPNPSTTVAEGVSPTPVVPPAPGKPPTVANLPPPSSPSVAIVESGAPSGGGSNDAWIRTLVGNQDTSLIRDSIRITENARGTELIDAAMARRREILSTAQRDQEILTEAYTDTRLTDYPTMLKQASRQLNETVAKLDRVQNGLPSGENARFRNIYMNAADKAAYAADIIEEEKAKADLPMMKLPLNIFNPPVGALPKLSEKLEEVVSLFRPAKLGGGNAGSATSPVSPVSPVSEEALTNRAVMFHGLAPARQAAIAPQLGMLYQPKLQLAGGGTISLPLLHNGYILGANETNAVDCSSFVGSLLEVDDRKTRFTTLDFVQMWKYKRQGKFMTPPHYPRERAGLIKKVAESFIPVDIYRGEALATGDIIVHRDPKEVIGHVALVKKYDPHRDEIQFIDASQTAGTVRERNLVLSQRDPRTQRRMVRPGFVALRLKASNPTACKYTKK